MKEKLHYAIEAVLVVAVIILFVFHFSENKKSSNTDMSPAGGATSGESMPIAYIDLDSLLSNYTYSIDLNEQITKKVENSHASLTEKLRKLQSDAAEFQRKLETNAFLSQERAESERLRLMRKDEELQNLQAKMSQELGEEQMRTNEELRKTIISLLRAYNKNKGFHIVYGKMNDNILYADGAYNITAEVLDYFNKQYAASPIAIND